MNESCAMIPTVRTKDGLIVDSKLFKDLMEYTGSRLKSKDIYLKVLGSSFLRENIDKFEFDENRQPTLRSVLLNFDTKSIIDLALEMRNISRRIGAVKSDGTPVKYRKLDDVMVKARQFNLNSPLRDKYVVLTEKGLNRLDNYTFWALKVYPKSPKYAMQASDMNYSYNLNQRLKDLLTSYGVSIGTITLLENRLGVSGVTDFSTSRATAEGLVELIRLALGLRGELALPEEFSHFILEVLKEESIVQRFLNSVKDLEELLRQILGTEYDKYAEMYSNNPELLATEVAGKILSDKLKLTQKYQDLGVVGRLVSRVVDKIKQFFSKWKASDFLKAIIDSYDLAGQLSKDILSGSLNSKVNLLNITSSEQYYNLTDRVNRDKKVLTEIIANEKKRLKRYKERNQSRFETVLTLLIEKLEHLLMTNQEVEGIYSFVDGAVKLLGLLEARLLSISTGNQTLALKARTLRDIRDYIYSYKGVALYILDALIDELGETDNRYGDRVKVALDQALGMIARLEVNYNKVGTPLIVQFMKPVVGETITAELGRDKGKEFALEELLKTADRDIGFWDRWFDSAAESSDKIIPILDQLVKLAKGNSRLSTINESKELILALLELELSGIKDTEWMFERYSDGTTTGNLIQDINYGLYHTDLKKVATEAVNKYGEGTPEAGVSIRLWISLNTDIINDKRVPKRSKYLNKVYASLTSALKKYYEKYMNFKEKYESYLPESNRHKYRAVLVRKDLIERVKSSTPKNAVNEFVTSIKNTFLRRVDDEEFGTKGRALDFLGNPVQALPIYYVRKLENVSELSTDATSSMIAFAAMANDFNEMNKIIDVLEVSRDILRDRKIAITEGKRTLTEKIDLLGSTVERTISKKQGTSNIEARINDFFEMLVYGRYMADEGTFGDTKIDKAKALNTLGKMTAINSMAVNLLAGISNVMTGTVMMRIESIAGEYFTYADTLKADREYVATLPEFLSEVGNRAKNSKLYLFDEMFDVLLDYEKEVREAKVAKKTWFSRMFGTSALFILNNAGEHWMLNRTALALANQYKMKNKYGKEVSLWDSLEVVPLDKSNPRNGSRLQVKEGFTKIDGSEFTTKDILEFTNKSKAINQKMHGIYNNLDKSAVQKLAIGRLAIMFRKWIKPALNRRFAGALYNYDLLEWTEGYYNTSKNFLMLLYHDLRLGQLDIISSWDKLHKTERANIKRAITESAHFTLLLLAVSLIDLGDDKRKNTWYLRMLEYQTKRLYMEIGALSPTPAMLSEGFKILKSPAAAVSTASDVIGMIDLLNPTNYTDEIKLGKYKGHSTAFKAFMNSPFAPVYKSVVRAINPELNTAFFSRGAF